MEKKQLERTSVITDILENVSEEETQNEQESEKEKSEVEETNTDESLITEEIAKDWGLPQVYIGKPTSELKNAYKNLRTDYHQKNKERSEIEKRLNQLEQQQLSQATNKTEKEEIKDIFESMPDPVDNPKEFKAFMKNAIKDAETNAEKNLLEKIQKEISPQLGQIQQFTQQQKEQIIYEQLQESLPEADLDNLIVEWGQENELIGDADSINYFLSKPKLMVNSILKFHESKEYKNLKSNVDTEIKEKTAKETVKNLKSAKNKTASDLNTQTRTKVDTKTPKVVSEVLELLEE